MKFGHVTCPCQRACRDESPSREGILPAKGSDAAIHPSLEHPMSSASTHPDNPGHPGTQANGQPSPQRPWRNRGASSFSIMDGINPKLCAAIIKDVYISF
jgi:hypothetical protein